MARRAHTDGNAETTVHFTVRAVFGAGTYFVTLRLEDRLAPTSFVPVDKQVGVMSFEMVKSPRHEFLGIVDAGVEAREIDEQK
jgi:hypothetical protein